MAKKGREARITRTIARVRGERPSAALRKRALTSGTGEDGAMRVKSKWRRRKDKERARVEARGDASTPHGYDGSQGTLLIGEGNGSFGLALATLFGGDATRLVVTTALTARASVRAYGESFCDTVEALEQSGASVAYGVACETLASEKARLALRERIGGSAFDRVAFHFPDAGCGRVGTLSVRAQRNLLTDYLEHAPKLLKATGELRVTMRTSEPYAAWNVEALAAKAGLAFKARVEFDPAEFPGYEYTRTVWADDEDGDCSTDDEDAMTYDENEEGPNEDAVTYVFVKALKPNGK